MPSSIVKTPHGIHIIRPHGKLVVSSLDDLKQLLDVIEPTDDVVLNLKQVNIIDSVAVGYLVYRYKLFRKKGGRFKLCHLQASVYKLLSLADLHHWFEIYDDEDKAVASILELSSN